MRPHSISTAPAHIGIVPLVSMSPPKLSVIIPAWNEQDALPITVARLVEMLDSDGVLDDTEIVVVSDGSTDGTVNVAAAALDGRVTFTVVELARNVGSHAAVRCGLRRARGDRIVVLSADGQDPPETIRPMLEKLAHGADIVWGQRTSRDNDPLSQRAASGLYYRLFHRLTGLEFPPAGLDFVAFTNQVNAAIHQYRERNLPLFLMLFNLGYEQAFVPYERGERVAGTTGWTLRKKIGLAIDMLTAFSAAPMRIMSVVGLIVGLLGLAYGGFTLIRGVVSDVPVSGWSSMIVLTSVMGGTILLAIATLGEYVWRSLDEARRRPIYLERNVIISDADPASPER